MLKNFLETSFIVLQIILPKHLLSRLVARLAESEIKWVKNTLINLAIDAFDIDLDDAVSSTPKDYKHFNDFFTRALKEGTRPIDPDLKAITSPCDGVVSQCGDIEKNLLFQAKGKYFDLKSLVGGDDALAEKFHNGQFATIYLSPRDYHRVHMPCTGTLNSSIYVPGELFSVNQSTAENIDGLFARNERLVNIFDTEQGPMSSILVGAMLVAGIETVWSGQVVPPVKAMTNYQSHSENAITLDKGDEMGRFKFGSTVILLFPKDTMSWREDFNAGQSLQMGEKIGSYL